MGTGPSQQPPDAERSTQRARLLVAGAAVFVSFLAGQAVLSDHPYVLRAFVDVVWTLGSAFTAFRCFRVARSKTRLRDARPWLLFAAGCGAWFLGMLVWSYYELALDIATPFPTVAELGFLATPVCWAAGLFAMRGEAGSPHLRIKQIGDLGVVLAALTIMSAQVLYAPVSDLDAGPVFLTTALAYPVLHFGAFAFGLLGYWQQPDGPRRRVYGFLLAAVAVLAAVNIFYSVSLLTDSYTTGGALDVFWLLAFAVTTWASHEEEWLALAPERHDERVRTADLAVVPAAAIAIAITSAMFRDRFRPELAYVFGVGGSFFALSILLREWGVHRIERSLRHEARAQAETHRRLVDSAPLGIARVDASGKVVESNGRFDSLLGVRSRDLVSEAWEDVGLAGLVRRALSTRTRVASESPLHFPGTSPSDRNAVSLRVAISPGETPSDGALVLIEDVTEEQRLQSELLQSQKMQAVGTLAGGIAHDFNNLLSGMIASVTLLRRRVPHDDLALLEHMEQSMWRAAELTQRLLALSRRRDPVRSLVDVGAVIERVVALLSRSVDETIAVRAQLPSGRVTFHGDGGQLEQALLNLGINARDAMRPRGGDLMFSLTIESQDGGANVAVIRVTDTGTGIAPGIRERIFEPFFTTKDPGEGTGLGLAMVYAFVQDHAGSIAVDSEVGRGTTIALRLPASDSVAVPVESERPVELPRGGETILAVDDREPALFAMKTILGDLGYTVTTAANGVEALAELERRKGHIDLVITDAMMRRMGGRDLLGAMRRRGIDIEVILATGHDAEAHRGIEGFAAVLRKPFDPKETARVVRDVLEGRRRGAPVQARSENEATGMGLDARESAPAPSAAQRS